MPGRIAVCAALAAALAVQEGPRAQRETTGVFILARTIVPHLPPAPLIWRLETFPSEDAARAAASPVSLVVKADGKTWLFTVAGHHGRSRGGVRVAEGTLPAVPQGPSYRILAGIRV